MPPKRQLSGGRSGPTNGDKRQRSIQPRIDQAPGMVSRKNVGMPIQQHKKSPSPEQFQQKDTEPQQLRPPADPAVEVREIEESEVDAMHLSWKEAEAKLKEFDMDTKYGPCMSMTRLERWRRAETLGLDPPLFIHNVIKAFPELKDKSVWHHRIHPEEPIIGV